MLEIPSQAPLQGVVRSQDSTERSWFNVSRFCYSLMKYSCDRRRTSGNRVRGKRPCVIHRAPINWPFSAPEIALNPTIHAQARTTACAVRNEKGLVGRLGVDSPGVLLPWVGGVPTGFWWRFCGMVGRVSNCPSGHSVPYVCAGDLSRGAQGKAAALNVIAMQPCATIIAAHGHSIMHCKPCTRL